MAEKPPFWFTDKGNNWTVISPLLFKKCKLHWLQVLISSTFYWQLFWTKLFCAVFMCLQLGFEIFGKNKIGTKSACKMLKTSQSFLIGGQYLNVPEFPNFISLFQILIFNFFCSFLISTLMSKSTVGSIVSVMVYRFH